MDLMDLDAFASEVGPPSAGPVAPEGGRTQWHEGGEVDADARPVRAPGGIVEYEPAEMTVRCGAGTPVAELDAALAERRQMVPLDPRVPTRATVGGVLATGHSGIRRLRYGPVRNAVLEVRYVSAEGAVVKAGGPVVKNVSGFDLCRLLVGSLGTLGVLAQVVLRVQPVPPVARWFTGAGDPFALRRSLFRPSSILWDGDTTWVLLEGHAADVEAERGALGNAFVETDGPPPLPEARVSTRPSEVRAAVESIHTPFVAEVGVGAIHVARDVAEATAAVRPRDPAVDRLNGRVKRLFDPTGRLNPGRRVA